jgi:phosphoenolpyruvate carboxykinase (ATP)
MRIPDTWACVTAIAERTIRFEEDPDFRYQVAGEVPGLEDEELLRPAKLYERQGRLDEYRGIVERLKVERVAHLQRFSELSEDIIKAVG